MNRRGFTLTELAIVLGVIGIILGAIWSAAAMIHQKQTSITTIKQIQTIASNIRALYAGRKVFASSATSNATWSFVNSGAIPGEMVVNGNVVSVWGGAFAVWTNTLSNSVFRLSYYGIKSSTCTEVATAIIGDAQTSGPINLVTVSGTAPDINLQTTTVDAVAIATACKLNTGSPGSSLEFDFNLN